MISDSDSGYDSGFPSGLTWVMIGFPLGYSWVMAGFLLGYLWVISGLSLAQKKEEGNTEEKRQPGNLRICLSALLSSESSI